MPLSIVDPDVDIDAKIGKTGSKGIAHGVDDPLADKPTQAVQAV